MKSFILFFWACLVVICPLLAQQHSEIIPSDVKNVIKRAQTSWVTGEFQIDPSFVQGVPPGFIGDASVSFDGTNYLVVWEDGRNDEWDYDIFGTRVNQSGEILDPGGFIICDAPGDQTEPVVAFDGNNYMVVWNDDRDVPPGSYDNIYGARVTQEGEVLDPGGFQICVFEDDQDNPDIAFDGTGYFVVWGDDRASDDKVYGTRVTVDADVITPDGFRISTSEGSNSYPKIAAGSENYLVVWSDYRNSLREIYGTRISFSGGVLDENGIRITNDSEWQTDPKVTSDGTDFFVIWNDERDDATSNVYGARVNKEGTVLDPSGIPVAVIEDYAYEHQVAFGNGHYLVTWDEYKFTDRDERKTYGNYVNTSGEVLFPEEFPLAVEEGFQHRSVAVSNGTDFFYVYENAGRFLYNRVDLSGAMINGSGTDISSSVNTQNYAAVASDGTDYLVVWMDTRYGNSSIFGIRTDGEGNPLDATSFLISGRDDYYVSPDVAYNGTNYLVVWNNYDTIFGSRISQEGNILDPEAIIISAGYSWRRSEAKVSSANTNWLVVWTDERNNDDKWGNMDIYGARVDAEGNVLDTDGIHISAAGNNQYTPDVCYGENCCLVVWTDEREGMFVDPDIYAARVDPDGTVMDPDGIGIAKNEDHFYQYPSLAFDGTNYMMAYYNYSYQGNQILGKRISQEGMPVDEEGIVIHSATCEEIRPDIAFDGDNYIVAWYDYTDGYYFDILGARINTAGNIIENLNLVDQPKNQQHPVVCVSSNHNMFLVYDGFTETVGEVTAMVNRLWGKFINFYGTENEKTVSSSVMAVFPNPAANQIYIEYNVSSGSKVDLSIYHAEGVMIKNYVREVQGPGNYLKCVNIQGYPSGIYIVKLQTGNRLYTQKLVVL